MVILFINIFLIIIHYDETKEIMKPIILWIDMKLLKIGKDGRGKMERKVWRREGRIAG